MKKILLLTIMLVFTFILSIKVTYAEQSGSSPDSGTGTSVLRTGYNWLVAKGTNYGATQPADWTNNWGTYWNRIMYSAFWEPEGTATESDVLAGKTFYSGNNNRTIKTGTTVSFLIDYSPQQYVQYDDTSPSHYVGDDATWLNTNTDPSTLVWKDTRTGVYWSYRLLTSQSNPFTLASCDFFTTTPRGSYGASSTDPDCGISINTCAVLSLASTSGGSANTDWYLPSQKEIQQAYIDGMYGQTGASFTTVDGYWSASEASFNYDVAWWCDFDSGYVINYAKTFGASVRCVRRD